MMRQVKTLSMSKCISLLLLLVIISTLYIIGAIQPQPIDDWHRPGFHLPNIPESGRDLRQVFGYSFLCLNAFSMLKPGILLAAIFLSILIWISLSNQKRLMRFGLTLLVGLGFPYYGHILTWNTVACQYVVAVIWLFLWYRTFGAAKKNNSKPWWIVLFVVSFFTSLWHEVWLISFSMVALFLLIESFYFRRNRLQSNKLYPDQIASIIVALAYGLAIICFTRGGTKAFFDRWGAQSNLIGLITNWPHIIKVLTLGTKENMVTLKDCIPIFALIGYIKLNKNFHTGLEKDFKLFLVMAAGVFLSSYLTVFVGGPFYWRVRWLHACILSLAFFAFPNSILINLTSYLSPVFLKIIRWVLLTLAVVWLSYNAYFTYYYINIDLVGWLQFRQTVLNHDDPRRLGNLEELFQPTLPHGRPKGTAKWDHAWGAQDNRYRFFSGPDFPSVRKRLEEYRISSPQ